MNLFKRKKEKVEIEKVEIGSRWELKPSDNPFEKPMSNWHKSYHRFTVLEISGEYIRIKRDSGDGDSMTIDTCRGIHIQQKEKK